MIVMNHTQLDERCSFDVQCFSNYPGGSECLGCESRYGCSQAWYEKQEELTLMVGMVTVAVKLPVGPWNHGNGATRYGRPK